MGFLQDLFKLVKGGRTDAQFGFDLIVSRLSSRQRQDLYQRLSAVQFAVDIAASVKAGDPRVKTASDWVRDAIGTLEQNK